MTDRIESSSSLQTITLLVQVSHTTSYLTTPPQALSPTVRVGWQGSQVNNSWLRCHGRLQADQPFYTCKVGASNRPRNLSSATIVISRDSIKTATRVWKWWRGESKKKKTKDFNKNEKCDHCGSSFQKIPELVQSRRGFSISASLGCSRMDPSKLSMRGPLKQGQP